MNTPNHQQDEIFEIILRSVEEINEQLPAENQISRSRSAPLVVGGDGLDSLAYVNLIASIEAKLEERLGKFVPFAEDAEIAQCVNLGDLAIAIQSKLTTQL